MPVLIYVIFVSGALFIGILTAPNFIGPVEPSGTIRFGMPAGHVPTTTAEMIALARKGAADIRLSSASRAESVAQVTPVASVSTSSAVSKVKVHKVSQRARDDQTEKRSITAEDRMPSRRTLAFIPRSTNEAHPRHGDLGNF
jgi:hypothetical protein